MLAAMTTKSTFEEVIDELAAGGGPVFEALARLNSSVLDSGELDERTILLMRFAALVAVDAPPASYLVMMAVAEDFRITPEQLQAGLIALAPVVGGPRVVSAAAAVQEAVRMAGR
jgi:4-carboxymuconolactone decarboxylase